MGKRYVAISREEPWSYGSSATVNASWAQYFDVVSESIAPDQGMIEVRTAGYRSMRKRVLGGYKLEGSIDFIGDPNEVASLLYMAFCTGSDVSSDTDLTTTTAYQYTVEPKQELNSFTAHIAPAVTDSSGTYKLRECVGGFITGLTLEASAGEILTVSTDWTFQKDKIVTDTINEADSAPGFSTADPLVFTQGSVEFDDNVIANVEAFSVTFENDIDTDAFVLGSRFLPGMRIQGFNVTGNMDIAFEDWTQYQRFLGSASAVMPSSTVSPYHVELIFTGGLTGNTGSYPNYALEIDMPEVYFDTTEATFDARDRIVQSIDFTAIHNGTRVVQAITVNTYAMGHLYE